MAVAVALPIQAVNFPFDAGPIRVVARGDLLEQMVYAQEQFEDWNMSEYIYEYICLTRSSVTPPTVSIASSLKGRVVNMH